MDLSVFLKGHSANITSFAEPRMLMIDKIKDVFRLRVCGAGGVYVEIPAWTDLYSIATRLVGGDASAVDPFLDRLLEDLPPSGVRDAIGEILAAEWAIKE